MNLIRCNNKKQIRSSLLPIFKALFDNIFKHLNINFRNRYKISGKYDKLIAEKNRPALRLQRVQAITSQIILWKESNQNQEYLRTILFNALY